MITIPLFEAAVAVGGRSNLQISPTDYIFHVTQRSQEVVEGTLFVALKGKRADGHDYVKEAEQKGAVAAVVEKEVSNVKIPQIVVPSTEEALGNLGRLWRCRLNIPVVAVTGSVGKTTTKELIAHILEVKYKTHKSRKNYNNQLGVPIELLRLEKGHECSVVEFGMRALNEISYLSKMARPSFAAITNIGMSHIEILKTRENIAKAKGEIFQGMDFGGVVVLNRDDDYYELLKELANCKVISFGESKEADIRISDIQLSEKAHPSFRINGLPITMLNCVGKHHAFNSAIAFAIAMEMGIDQEDIIKQISTFSPPEKRGVVSFLNNGALILDSTYNAAPDSIKASLYTISELTRRGKRTVAVIGEMLELGSHSKEAHSHIGKVISELKGGIDFLVTVGEYAEYIGKESKIENRKHFGNSTLAANFLVDNVESNDIILLQASNSVSLDVVVNALENKFGVQGKDKKYHKEVIH
ncbi:UDP-N-acetylmuramoyl-tripeptide--D-alanyl-D-alanine ligase [Abyssalbus ytuae]|uniref:UDP-N-acetylmuramoyl-tripeptide--D-alanyl-D-alanine ligase n=1 Tax=Abyssalbus ytuae TaxID=2926907 RepID=A0A9E6ZPD7_9FLAO|nr:UDP-N-acetylmuramoyl-tripeptide--D-alanyl-D-alanine ligase [Abyssalbus ytuae]UOB18439.1 UDP-N-acetylmuramoyl-tripeptide--D-alanyl-D-alanine ligase [Abyssalbus ytuae]